MSATLSPQGKPLRDGYIILSVYSPFSDRVGLPSHNILSRFPVMDIFAGDLKFRFYIL